MEPANDKLWQTTNDGIDRSDPEEKTRKQRQAVPDVTFLGHIKPEEIVFLSIKNAWLLLSNERRQY